MTRFLILALAIMAANTAQAQGWVSFPEDMKRVMISPWVEIDTNNFTPEAEAAALKKCAQSLITPQDTAKSERLIHYPGSKMFKGDLDIRVVDGKTMLMRREGNGIFGFPFKWYRVINQQGVVTGSFTRIQYYYNPEEKRYQRGRENAEPTHFTVRIVGTHAGVKRALMVYPISSRTWQPVNGAAAYLRCGDLEAAFKGTEK